MKKFLAQLVQDGDTNEVPLVQFCFIAKKKDVLSHINIEVFYKNMSDYIWLSLWV